MHPKLLIFDEIIKEETVLSSILKKEFPHVEIIECHEFEEVLEVAYDERVDLILINFLDRNSEGFRILEYMHNNSETQTIPAIVIIEESNENLEKLNLYNNIDMLSKPLNMQKIRSKLHIYFELIQKNIEIQKHEEIIDLQLRQTEAILDAQDAMLVVCSEENIILGNAKFLKFFNLNSIEEFLIDYGCLNNVFVSSQGCFKAPESHRSSFWINLLEKEAPENRNVAMRNDEGTLQRFHVKLFHFELKGNHTVISLTDISEFFQQALEYEKFANTDPLTQIANRRSFKDSLVKYIEEADKTAQALSLIMFDLDHFKSINDTYGHDRGDEVLRQFANTINLRVRKQDVLARWGGEEFILALRNTSIAGAEQLAESLRTLTHTIIIDDKRHLSVSIGVGQYENSDTMESFIKKVDQALYKAKQTGRDKVQLAENSII